MSSWWGTGFWQLPHTVAPSEPGCSQAAALCLQVACGRACSPGFGGSVPPCSLRLALQLPPPTHPLVLLLLPSPLFLSSFILRSLKGQKSTVSVGAPPVFLPPGAASWGCSCCLSACLCFHVNQTLARSPLKKGQDHTGVVLPVSGLPCTLPRGSPLPFLSPTFRTADFLCVRFSRGVCAVRHYIHGRRLCALCPSQSCL